MAQYRLSVLVAKRSDSRSATAMAAYRACEVVDDHRTGERFDFSRKRGLLYAEVIAPEGAPEWARDRQELWNRSEIRNTRRDAIVAREIQLSLPHELNHEQRRELTAGFARFMAEKYQISVDTCIHAPGKEGDERNHHAHLLVCTRPIDETKAQGLGNNIRELDAVACQRGKQENHVETWRSTWAQMMNDALERANIRGADGAAVSVDHRSYGRQGVDQEPTIKEGTAATAKKRRGEYTERAETNDDIRARNAEREQLTQELSDLSAQLDALYLRRANQMTADEAGRELLTAERPDIQPIPRRAQVLPADQVRQTMEPANDNKSHLADYEKPLPWETEKEAQDSAKKAAAREEEQRRQRKNDERSDHHYGR